MSPTLEERLFTLVALAVTLGMTFLSFTYRAPARLVPLAVGAVTSAIFVFLAATVFVPRVRGWWRKIEKSPLASAIEDGTAPEEREAEARRKRVLEFRVLGWLVGLVGLVYLFGFLPSTFVFVLLFLRFAGKESWKTSLLIAVCFWALVYAVFVLALGIRLHGGVLFGA